MRYLTILAVTLLASCSWSWPWQWGGSKTDNCMDDGSCSGANPFEEELIGGTWYCYGTRKDQPWDCGRKADDSKIAAIVIDSSNDTSESEQRLDRAEMFFDNSEALISEAPGSEPPDLFQYADTSYAVQLIAVQTLEEVERFAARHGIEEPNHVRITTQGDDWYVVLLDIFEDKGMADQAADEWFNTHRPFSRPWVRPLGPLKAAAQRASATGA